MVSRGTVLLAAFGLLACVAAAETPQVVEWKFSSAYGQQYSISYDYLKEEFATRAGDVTSRVNACGDDRYVVCFSDRLLTLAIPRQPIAPGARWTVGGSSFEVVARIDQVRILDVDLEDVLVINATRSAKLPLDVRAHRFRVLFSYSNGLVAFGEIEDEDDSEPVLFFAMSLPSLGGPE